MELKRSESSHGRVAGIALGVVFLVAGCGPPPRVFRLSPGGVHANEDTVWVTAVVQGSPDASDQLVVVTCPRSTSGGIQSDQCWWQRTGDPGHVPTRIADAGASGVAPGTAGALPGRAAEAISAAASAHGCPRERVELQSDGTRDGVEGYWLLVCGQQRFMQWDERGQRFVDRTPDR